MTNLILAGLSMLIGAVEPASAQESGGPSPDFVAMQFQDWAVIITPGASEAGTLNPAGNALGFVCGQQCVHFLDVQEECRDGSSYRAVANVDDRRFDLGLTCHPLEDRKIFIIDMSPAYLTALSESPSLTFDIALDKGRNTQAAFSLLGCNDAVHLAAEAVVAEGPAQGP
ncbi:hypothetical protein [Allosphingosinicella vermicomposti]|uniref:hypothetical protein n=1 Tax=Allosphingosinicella vermicomposti TaxID=614671 RepID=UPI00131A5085|nr:hypothetical protein [Allosphingosinicella vermicomposti]